VSNNRHHQQWTPADADGRSSQVRHAVALAVRTATWLRDEEASGPARAFSSQHNPRLSASVRVCPLRCRIQPYLRPAAPRRGAGVRRSPRRALPWKARPARPRRTSRDGAAAKTDCFVRQAAVTGGLFPATASRAPDDVGRDRLRRLRAGHPPPGS
jgi:hypothetical protein